MRDMGTTAPRWIAIWFRGAALYGAVALLASLAQPAPSPGAPTHYGFIGTALAFQAVFWIIACTDMASWTARKTFSAAESAL